MANHDQHFFSWGYHPCHSLSDEYIRAWSTSQWQYPVHFSVTRIGLRQAERPSQAAGPDYVSLHLATAGAKVGPLRLDGG